MNYLSQEIQCKLQVLQPLSVDGIDLRELGSKSSFLQRNFRRAVSRQANRQIFPNTLFTCVVVCTVLHYRGSRWELPCVWHWARTPSRLPLSYIDITAPKQVLPPCLWVSQRPASREPLAVSTQLTSSFTLAAGDCSLALLFTWLLRPFSKSSKDLSFSASSS